MNGDPLGLRDSLGLRAQASEGSVLPRPEYPEVFSDWWADFLKNDPANREKVFYSLVTAQDTGLPPSLIYENTDKPPANWMRQNEVTLTKTIREILEIPKSLGEVGLTFVSGAVGWGVSSILGIAEATKPGASRESVRAVMEDAGRRIGYEPETRPAREFLGRAGRLISAAIAPAGEAAALVGESWDSPFLEAVLRFAGEAAIFNLIGKGAEKVQKPPDWYYRLTVRERGVVEGIKADITSGELTPEQIRYLWKDPANRAELLKRYQGIAPETAPEVAGKVTKQASGETLPEVKAETAGTEIIVEPGATSRGKQPLLTVNTFDKGPVSGERVFIRIGDIVKKSKDWNTGVSEPGMSVYTAIKGKDGRYVIVGDEIATSGLDEFIGSGKPVYEVRGKVAGEGVDGEPALMNHKIVQKISPDKVHVDSFGMSLSGKEEQLLNFTPLPSAKAGGKQPWEMSAQERRGLKTDPMKEAYERQNANYAFKWSIGNGVNPEPQVFGITTYLHKQGIGTSGSRGYWDATKKHGARPTTLIAFERGKISPEALTEVETYLKAQPDISQVTVKDGEIGFWYKLPKEDKWISDIDIQQPENTALAKKTWRGVEDILDRHFNPPEVLKDYPELKPIEPLKEGKGTAAEIVQHGATGIKEERPEWMGPPLSVRDQLAAIHKLTPEEAKRFPKIYEKEPEPYVEPDPPRLKAPKGNAKIIAAVPDKPWEWTANDLVDIKPSERKAKLEKIWGPEEEFDAWWEGEEPGPRRHQVSINDDLAADLDTAVKVGYKADIENILDEIQKRLDPWDYYAYEEIQNAGRGPVRPVAGAPAGAGEISAPEGTSATTVAKGKDISGVPKSEGGVGKAEYIYPKAIGGQGRLFEKGKEYSSDDINLLLDMAARTDTALGPAPTTEYDKIRAEAARIAYEKTSKKIDLNKRREARALERQGREEVREDPVYLAIEYAIKQGGLNRDKLLRLWDKDTVNELARKRIGLVTKEGKLGLDEVAEDHGFVSDDALMNMMLDWKGLSEAGKKAAAEFEERYSDLMSEAEKEDFHLVLLEEEAKILRKMIRETGKPSAPGIKKAIRENTGQIRVDELMISEYEALKAGMRKAEIASRKAFRAGSLEATLAEKERQIEMATSRREKLKAREEAKKIHDGIIKLTKDKSIPEDYQDRIADLLENFDLLPRSDRTARRVESAREFLERQKAAGEDVSIPESMLARIERYGRTHWRELTLDQLREIYDQAQMYGHLGKLKNKLIAAKEKRDFEGVVATIVTEIGKNWGVKPVSPAEMETIFLEKTFGEKLGDFKESYLASLTKVETYLRRLDGFKDLGPIWESVYLPVKQASDVEYRRLAEITTTLRELFDPVKKSLTKEKFRVPGVDQFLTRETVVMTAMNSGNEGNLDALKENRVYNWDDAKVKAVLDKVTPEEWLLVRGVWDMFEKQYPDLATVYKNLSGTTLQKVEGDYFPLVFDRRLSWIADRNATEKELRDFFQSIYTLPSVKTGSTIARVGGKLPPKLKFSVIFEKLAEINHYITHAEAVRDVQKILADPRVRAAIEGAPNGIGGPEAYREMMTWLQDVARQRSDPMSAVEAAIKTVRINTSVVAMGWKFSTAVVQFLGWANTVYKVGLGESSKALAEFYTNREGMVDKIKGMSAELSGRAKVFDRELRDAYNRIGLDQFRGSQVMKDSFFSLIATMDMAVAYPTWLAAYNKGMKDFAGEESKAIEFADMTTRMTQGTALVKDLAGIQRGAELKKILSLFYTFFSAYHQLMADAWIKFKFDKTGQNFGDLMRAWWWLTILPATVDYMIKEREVPSPGEFVKNVLQMRLTAYPVVRDITGAVLTDYDYQFSPVSRAGEVVGRFAKEISKAVTPEEEVDYDKLLRYGLESAGYMTGLPTGQAVVTMNGLMDLWNGETSDVTRLLVRAPREENE